VQKFQLAPGSCAFQFGSGMITDFSFTVTAEGQVTLVNKFSGFSEVTDVDGVATVVISGVEVTDALSLTGANPSGTETGVLLANLAEPNHAWIPSRKVRLRGWPSVAHTLAPQGSE
jgi:hypothetical protein